LLFKLHFSGWLLKLVLQRTSFNRVAALFFLVKRE
jgi:hypothetical protein